MVDLFITMFYLDTSLFLLTTHLKDQYWETSKEESNCLDITGVQKWYTLIQKGLRAPVLLSFLNPSIVDRQGDTAIIIALSLELIDSQPPLFGHLYRC